MKVGLFSRYKLLGVVDEEVGDIKVSFEVYSRVNHCLVLHIQSCS